jgi:hypothetical protein
MKAGEGLVEVTDGRVWDEVVGSGDATPLLVLHGGPGFTHEYMRSLEALADERPVVFEESSQMSHLEERERNNDVIREFLREVEGERVR